LVCPDNGDVKPIRLIFVAGLLWSYALAGEAVCSASAPAVDPEAKVDAQQDSALAAFDKQVAIVAAKPKAEDIVELAGTVRRLADLENKSMSSAFHLTSGNSVRSVPSAEMEAHLDAMKALRKAQELLDEAKDSAEAHVPHEAQLRIAAAAKELAKARKHVAAKRKARPKKAKTESKGKR
jgi:hypothetical protein